MTWVNLNNFIHHTSKESLHGSKTHIFSQRITLRDEQTGQEYALVWMKHSKHTGRQRSLPLGFHRISQPGVFIESHNHFPDIVLCT